MISVPNQKTGLIYTSLGSEYFDIAANSKPRKNLATNHLRLTSTQRLGSSLQRLVL